MLLNTDNLAFTGRRIGLGGAWQMPQGGIDPGEDPPTAALRELEEEIGTGNAEILAESRDWLSYDLPKEFARKAWGGRYRGQQQKWYAMRFLGDDQEIDLTRHTPEFDKWKWVRPGDLIRLIVPFKRPLYETILNEFAPLLDGKPR